MGFGDFQSRAKESGEAQSFLTLNQTVAPIGGAVVGGIFGGPAGAQIGGAAGTASAGLLSSLFGKKPKITENTGTQKGLLAAQMANLEQLMEQRGLSATEVQRLSQASALQRQQELQRLNAISQAQRLSPLEREGLLAGMMTAVQQRQVETIDKIAALDERAEARRLANITAQTQAAFANAQAVAQGEMKIQMLNQQMDAQAFNNFSVAMAGIAKNLPAAMNSQSQAAEAPTAEGSSHPAQRGTQTTSGTSGDSLGGTPTPPKTNLGAAVGAESSPESQGVLKAGPIQEVPLSQKGIDQTNLQKGFSLTSSIDFVKAMGIDDDFFFG